MNWALEALGGDPAAIADGKVYYWARDERGVERMKVKYLPVKLPGNGFTVWTREMLQTTPNLKK